MNVKPGWHGRFYEDFEVGGVYEHPLGRTVTSADNIWFTLLTQNTAPLHFANAYAAQTEFGRPLVNSCFTLSLVLGQGVTDTSQNALANPGWAEVRLPHPVLEGHDLLHLRGHREAGVQIAIERGDRHGENDPVQPEQGHGYYVQAAARVPRSPRIQSKPLPGSTTPPTSRRHR